MAYSQGDLNGSGPFYIGIDVWYSGAQDWGANTSRFDWQCYIGCYDNGWGTWASGGQAVSVNCGGVIYNGSFGLDFRPSGSSGRRYGVLGGSTWHGHDGNGYRPGFPTNAYIDTNHSSVGDGGSGDAWVDAPRIPQPSNPPTNLQVTNVGVQGFTVTYTNGDPRGGNVSAYRVRWYEINGADNPLIWTDNNSSGGTDPRGVGIYLKPATTYNVYVSQQTERGWSAEAGIAGTTLSGIYRWNGSSWVGQEARVWNGTEWVLPDFMVRNPSNNGWVLAS